MLTLFKPWRSGKDLKNDNQTWDDAFQSHTFSEYQLQIMKNFNIRYECLDARDDYRTQLKKGKHNMLFMFGEDNDITTGNKTDNGQEDDCFLKPVCEESYDGSSESQIYGPQEQKLQKEAAAIHSVLTQTGWTTITNHTHDQNKDIFVPACKMTGPQWKAAVQLQKKNLVENDSSSLKDVPNSFGKNQATSCPEKVKIVSKHYLQKHFYSTPEEDTINSISSAFNLNEDQERAFKIIAHHAVLADSQQLKMYIGGMGGTGKTRVIKAIAKFFMECGKSSQFVTVAPTGTAAALISGSTYHSKFGINDFLRENDGKPLTLIRSRLLMVKYIFLDEVSMLSCHDLYRISAQLARIFNYYDVPFGGINIIFSGDFGQLPPPVGGENVSLFSRTIGKFASSWKAQEETMGKALWQQITTVVILRQNMRQVNYSPDDVKLRTALQNMRYKDCTPEDITFLKTRITSHHMGSPSICDSKYAHISIITAKNIQKDEINKLGCIKFAKMTRQNLTLFFSEDSEKTNGLEHHNKHRNSVQKVTSISYDLQKELWDLPHSTADKHIPGKLSLCLSMPIMIKHNEATELCITNGQEATVVGWQSSKGSWNQQILDTLFVELTNPPTPVQITNLPPNVVPLTRNERTITCKLRNDNKITFNRSQVEIVPNFAMTDYASQGKTRTYNVVDLHDCCSHQAYYTAMSRGTTAENTIILQNFDERKIRGKASGALHQEFRELELLDEITKLHYNDKLPDNVAGCTRNTLIASYRTGKGHSYIPSSLHPSLTWNTTDPFLQPCGEDMDWQMIKRIRKSDNNKQKITSTATEHNENQNLKKRKVHMKDESNRPKKKQHNDSPKQTHHIPNHPVPVQFTWRENSCAFDAYFSILYALWYTDMNKWSNTFQEINRQFLGLLAKNFQDVNNGTISINTARDNLRLLLADNNPDYFSWGHYTSLYDLMDYTLQTPEPILQSKLMCENEHIININNHENTRNSCLITTAFSNSLSIQHYISTLAHEENQICPTCNTHMKRVFSVLHAIPLILFDFTGQKINLDHTIEIDIQNSKQQYSLRGILYYGNNHFTSRFISHNTTVWFHDGISTGASMIRDGILNSDIDLLVCRNMHACGALYEASDT